MSFPDCHELDTFEEYHSHFVECASAGLSDVSHLLSQFIHFGEESTETRVSSLVHHARVMSGCLTTGDINPERLNVNLEMTSAKILLCTFATFPLVPDISGVRLGDYADVLFLSTLVTKTLNFTILWHLPATIIAAVLP